MNEQNNALKEMDAMPVSKAVLRNILPAIASMLMSLIYNMADKVFIGMTGNDYMVAAVTMATPAFVLFLAFGNIFATGGVSLISRFTGEGKRKEIDQTSSFCFWGGLGLGVIIMIALLIFMNPIIKVLGATNAETISYTQDYLRFIAVCCPFAILAQSMASLVRADGKPMLSMIGMVLGNIVNIILDPIFILGLQWGTSGAAVATLIGQMASAAFYIICMLRKKTSLSVRPADFTFRGSIATRVFAIGTPSALASIFQSICNIVMNNQMAQYGDYAVAGIGAAQNLITVIGIFAIGIAMGIQPLLGYQVGNHNRKRFDAILRYSMILTLASSIIITILCYAFITPIVRLFVSDAVTVDYGVRFARIIMSTAWLYCVFTVCSLVLQAMGRATASLVVNMSRNCYIFIPVMLLMGRIMGIDGIVFALPVSDIVCVIIALLVLVSSIKKSFAEEQDEEFQVEIPDMAYGNKGTPIIVIGRSYGAGGRSVGKMVAEQLGIPFYDKKILASVAEKSGLSRQYLEKVDEKSPVVYTRDFLYTWDQPETVQSIAHKAQREVIAQIADKGSCVIVGRRADQILKGRANVISVFISASPELRAERIAKREGIPAEQAKSKLRKADKERANYYNSLSGRGWGQAENYDLCLDADAFSLEGVAEIIISAAGRLKGLS